jgi:putative redox protein
MTIGMYAARKGLQLPPFTVDVEHAKVLAEDGATCVDGTGGKIDQFEVRITFDTDPDLTPVFSAV